MLPESTDYHQKLLPGSSQALRELPEEEPEELGCAADVPPLSAELGEEVELPTGGD